MWNGSPGPFIAGRAMRERAWSPVLLPRQRLQPLVRYAERLRPQGLKPSLQLSSAGPTITRIASAAAAKPKVPVTGVAEPNPVSQLIRRDAPGSGSLRTLPSAQGKRAFSSL